MILQTEEDIETAAHHMSNDFYSNSGNWYKGSVHNHTVESDGELTAVDLAKWYQSHGMDFMAVTDHNVVADLSGTEDLDILVISGEEILVRWEETFGAEILALGVDETIEMNLPPQQAIDEVLKQGGIPFLSHPHLSGVPSHLILQLERLVGIEVYGPDIDLYWNRGNSCVHWDELMSAGRNIFGLATEDRHSIDDGKPEAWIMVKSPANTRDDILAAIGRGDYYSSTGPAIQNVEFDGKGNVRVTCPEAKRINVSVLPWASWSHNSDRDRKHNPMVNPLSGAWVDLGRAGTLERCKDLFQSGGKGNPLTHMKDFHPHVRLEVVDGQGRTAWTNPMPIPS